MKLRFRCGCGARNYNLGDWTCHWTSSVVRGWKGKLRAIRHFLLTRIEITKY